VIWLPLGAAVMLVILAIHGRGHLRRAEVRWFQVLCVLTATWSLFQAADLSLTALDEKVLVMKLKFTVAPFISVAIFGLLASHSGRSSLLTKRNLVLLSVLPVASVLLAYTAELHALFIHDFRVASLGPSILQWSTGPLFWVYIVGTYGLMLAGIVLLVRSVRDANPLYRKQAAIMILALLPPTVFEILASADRLPESFQDLALTAFAMSATIMAWGLNRYRILDVRPIARGEVVESMADAMVVIDNDDRLIDLNRSAGPLLTLHPERALGAPAAESLRCGADVAALLRSGSLRGQIVVGQGAERRTYDASVQPIVVRGETSARMVLMRDITERERAEEALHAANERLGILSSMTRHDLLNRLAVIDGYLALALKEKDPVKARAFMEKTERSSEAARSLLEFTADYERVGIKAPAWLRVDEVFAHAAAQFSLDTISLSVHVEGLSVYADAMLEKVFYNLIDNTLRHGGQVSGISLGFEAHRDRLSLIYRDDGIGIPGREKPLIFLRGFGANTGLGLFLAREVLAITGIDIVENGELGKGARFEMLVPGGGFRLETQAEDIALGRDDAGKEDSTRPPTLHRITSCCPPSCPTTH
jgi:PAS domain S-box-containing protein